MLQNFCVRWGGLISKISAVLLAATYLIVISVVEYSPYVWLSLILVLMLCLTLFAYSRDKPLIRWRANRSNAQRTDNTDQATTEMTEVPAAIWMTDVPPTYSIVMATNAPVTPPPSYGSALVMFPWIATGQQSPDVSRLLENARFRSVSRQASEISGNFNCNNTSISRETSSNNLRFETISRQTSLRLDNLSNVTNQLSAISRQISQLTVLSRQISLQESRQHDVLNQHKDTDNDDDDDDDEVFVDDTNHFSSTDDHENQQQNVCNNRKLLEKGQDSNKGIYNIE